MKTEYLFGRRKLNRSFMMIYLAFGILFVGYFLQTSIVFAQSDKEDTSEDMITVWEQQMYKQWHALDEVTADISDELTFDRLVRKLLENPTGNWWESVGDTIFQAVKQQWNLEKKRILQLLFLGVLSAFFVDFTDVTLKKYIGEVGYFAIYTVMLTILLITFQAVYQLTLDATKGMLHIAEAIVPVFTGGLLLSGNTKMAFGSYTVITGGIGLVEWACMTFLFPAIYFYFVLQMLNHSMKEDRFSRLAQFIKNVVVWMFRLLFGLIVGMQVVQSLLLPASDQAKNSNFSKSLAAIPGLGASARALTNTLFQSSNVLKNTVGVAAMIVLLCCVLAPVIRLLFYIWTYQLLAALLQPVAHKRVTSILSAVSSSAKLLFQGLVTCTVLFLVNLVVVTAATSTVV